MFSTFKKFFSRQGSDVVEAPAPARATAPAGFTPANVPPRRSAAPEAAPRSAAPVPNVQGSLAIPLKAILPKLAPELAQRVRQVDLHHTEVSIPLQKVLSQISHGSVKMTYGELRLLAPLGAFSPETDKDRTMVEIPLHEVLARLDPSLLPRRATQKHVNVPAEIAGPFGNQNQVSFSTSILKAPAAPAPVEPEPELEPITQFTPPPISARPRVQSPVAAPAPAPAAMPFAPMKPVAPARPAMPQQQKPVVVPFPAPQPAHAQVPAQHAAQPAAPARPFQPAVAFTQAQAPAPARPAPIRVVPAASTSPAALANPGRKNPVDDDAPIFMRAAPATPQQPAPAQPLSMPRPAAQHFAPPTPVAPQFEQPEPDEPAVVAMPKISPVPRKSVITPIAPEVEPEPAPIRFTAPKPAPAPAPVAMPSPAAETRFLTIAVAELAGAWPGAVQQEIMAHSLMTSSVALPFGIVEAALKQGKFTVPWKVLRGWLKPPATIPSSANDAMMLELPLKIIAPLFLAEMKGNKPQRKLTVDASIPALFSNRLESLPSEPHTGAVAAFAAASAAPEPPPPVALKQSDTNYFARQNPNASEQQPDEVAPPIKPGPSPGTAFLKRYATPNDIVTKASKLPGVDGALIALPDGLLVASVVPPQVNADTIAGFLPQIFTRVSQSVKELRMGDINNLNFTVGSIPWKIFKVGAIYFAAFGRAGEPLPSAQLAGIAAELDRKAK